MSDKNDIKEQEDVELKDDINDTDCDECNCGDETMNCESDTEKNETQDEKEIGKGFRAKKKNNAEIKKLTAQIIEKDKEIAEQKDKYIRLLAEFENYKRRTAKELDGRYDDAKCNILKSILPVLDNFERALAAFDEGDPQKQGVNMIFEQFKALLAANGVSEIEALGAQFDPVYHNAVMHIDDPELGTNVVAEVFEKGYKTEDKVLRYSMVKVAN